MITVMTEKGQFLVYDNNNIIPGIKTLKIHLFVGQDDAPENGNDPRVLFLEFANGFTAYFAKEVQFDIHTNGGYSIQGSGAGTQIKHTGGDAHDPSIIPNNTHVLGRIQDLILEVNLETFPIVKLKLDITDSYHIET